MDASINRLLKETQEELSKSGIEKDLWPAAFGRVFDLVLEKASDNHRHMNQTDSPDGPSSSMLELISRKVRISANVVEEIFYSEEGSLGVTLPTQGLDQSKKSATKQIALIVAAGRQAAEIEEWTSSTTIRDVCEDYGKLDTPNFAATISSMDDVFRIRGKGQAREVRVRQPGFEKMQKLVLELFGKAR